jgi:hypothetical protein
MRGRLFDAGSAGQGNCWAGGSDVAVRTGQEPWLGAAVRRASGAHEVIWSGSSAGEMGPVRLLSQAQAIPQGGTL